MSADRHLLLGLLALQNEFIDKRQLVTAFGIWIADHSKSLDEILIQIQAIREEDRLLLSRLVDRHVAAKGGDIAASLRSFHGDSSVRDELERLADGEVKNSVAKLKPMVVNTLLPARGQETSAGRRFEIRRPLDRGGLGVVSVALDKELNREVALKEIRTDCADEIAYRAKFMLEAEVTGGLEHPGIVPVYGFGTGPDGRPFYAMRLIRGDNLHAHIKRFHEMVAERRETFDGAILRSLLRRFLDVCEAIEYAHARGVLHRDLKPGNVMLGKYGETLVVDWGLAKPQGIGRMETTTIDEDSSPLEPSLIPSSFSDGLTLQGSVVGTAAYAPPEQLTGNLDKVSERSDIYGLGAILFEILTNQPPAKGESLEAIMRMVVSGSLKSSLQVQPLVPKPLDAVCSRALATNPGQRYATAGALRAEIERWLDDLPVESYPEPWSKRAGRWLKRHETTAIAISSIVLMATLGLGLFSVVMRRNNTQLSLLNTELVDQRTVAHQYRSDAIERYSIAKEAIDATLVGITDTLDRIPGADRLQKELLEKAAADYERLSKNESDDPELELERIRALVRLADIHHLQNLTDAAHTKYREALDVADERLKQWQTQATFHEQHLAVAIEQGKIHARIGFALDIENRIDAATRAFDTAEDILRRLLDDNPSSDSCRKHLATTLMGKASLLERTTSPEAALPLFQASLALFKKLPETALQDFGNGMARCEEGLGRVERQLGKYDEARRAFIGARETITKRIDKSGNDTNGQLDLASLSISIANLERSLGGFTQALSELATSTNIYQRLRDAFPEDAQIKEVWAMNEIDISAIHLDMGSPTVSKDHAFPAVQAFDELVTAFPTIPAYRYGLALALDLTAQSLMETETPSENIELAFQRSAALCQDLAKSFANSSSNISPYQFLLATVRIHYAKYLQSANRIDEAKVLISDVTKEFEQEVGKKAREPELVNLLAHAYFRRAILEEADEQHAESQKYFALSIKLRRDQHTAWPTAETAYQWARAILRSSPTKPDNIQELLKTMEKANELGIASLAHDNLLAEVYFVAGDAKSSRQLLDSIQMKRGYWNAEDYCLLARIQSTENRKEEAKESLKLARQWQSVNRPFDIDTNSLIERAETSVN